MWRALKNLDSTLTTAAKFSTSKLWRQTAGDESTITNRRNLSNKLATCRSFCPTSVEACSLHCLGGYYIDFFTRLEYKEPASPILRSNNFAFSGQWNKQKLSLIYESISITLKVGDLMQRKISLYLFTFALLGGMALFNTDQALGMTCSLDESTTEYPPVPQATAFPVATLPPDALTPRLKSPGSAPIPSQESTSTPGDKPTPAHTPTPLPTSSSTFIPSSSPTPAPPESATGSWWPWLITGGVIILFVISGLRRRNRG